MTNVIFFFLMKASLIQLVNLLQIILGQLGPKLTGPLLRNLTWWVSSEVGGLMGLFNLHWLELLITSLCQVCICFFLHWLRKPVTFVTSHPQLVAPLWYFLYLSGWVALAHKILQSASVPFETPWDRTRAWHKYISNFTITLKTAWFIVKRLGLKIGTWDLGPGNRIENRE